MKQQENKIKEKVLKDNFISDHIDRFVECSKMSYEEFMKQDMLRLLLDSEIAIRRAIDLTTQETYDYWKNKIRKRIKKLEKEWKKEKELGHIESCLELTFMKQELQNLLKGD